MRHKVHPSKDWAREVQDDRYLLFDILSQLNTGKDPFKKYGDTTDTVVAIFSVVSSSLFASGASIVSIVSVVSVALIVSNFKRKCCCSTETLNFLFLDILFRFFKIKFE